VPYVVEFGPRLSALLEPEDRRKRQRRARLGLGRPS
jgi:hypothetical protein